MRISGQKLRTPVVLHPALGDTGDGQAYGPDRTVRAWVKRRTAITADGDGATLTVWATIQIRPTVRVEGASGLRPVAPGDAVTVAGVRRQIESVEPIQGPGTAIVGYELVAGDG